MTIFTDKVKKYNTRLMADLSISREQACGIWGNLGTETGGFTALQEIKPTVAGSRGGYGWMMWTAIRRRRYEAWCQQNMFDPTSDEANYKYLVHETKTDELASLIALRKAKTVEEATEIFMKKNLRPGVPHLDNRKRWAAQADAATKIAEVQKPVENTQKTSTTVGVAVGAGGLMYFFQEHWMTIAICATALVGIFWYVIRRHHSYQEDLKIEQELAKLPEKKVRARRKTKSVKKGKKNGQKGK